MFRRNTFQSCLRLLAITLVGLSVGLLVAVQVQQRLFRHHVVRLLADMQAVELHRTGWADAEKLMRRWGRWGHYEGSCTSSDCLYEISVESPAERLFEAMPERLLEHIQWSHVDRAFDRMGGIFGRVSVKFIVQDQKIVRKGIYVHVAVPPGTFKDDRYGYGLILSSVSLQRITNWQVLHSDVSYAKDPYYTAVRPGGCKICMEVTLVYSDRTPRSDVRQLNTVNVACLVGPTHCTTIEDIFPPSEPFHLYDGALGARPEQQESTTRLPLITSGCHVPLWVLGRDAERVYAVDVLRTQPVEGVGFALKDEADVRFRSALIGDVKLAPGVAMKVFGTAGHDPNFPGEDPIRFDIGKKYLFLTFGRSFEEEPPDTRTLRAETCGVFPDNPEVRRSLQQGIDSRDHLRQPELPHWPYH